ncbi:glycosyltransferase family 2 protein [Paraburkholderia sp. LEh10]|uniref:glycosyltransferase family 2 protein n=1 Tax=Paraburkholderia sp. LEh10 TaxID=2821353 RepID=UPI001AE363B4|nr:glycosyltransferase family 2 protein [Paraburkholderia sp. LEh10]MBP0593881.1 glycosyltransferase family 2 protein [Paraburkholderia sp. LEh10]
MNVSSAPSTEAKTVSVSVVVYHPEPTQLRHTLDSLRIAVDELRLTRPDTVVRLFIVDNGGLSDAAIDFDSVLRHEIVVSVIGGHGNIGYGRGHNLAIERAQSRFHLVLNPDIDIDRDALVQAFDFFDHHPEAGLLTPCIGDDEGHLQYLCRRYPSLLDLLIRGFLPYRVREFFSTRLASYEMRDLINEHDIVWDPPIVSGCFMLFRTDVLKRLAGFDPRYFLYFEDYDLSLRTHKLARVVYAPAVRVLHHGGGAARKGSAHIRMFTASAFKFFKRFGWKWL